MLVNKRNIIRMYLNNAFPWPFTLPKRHLLTFGKLQATFVEANANDTLQIKKAFWLVNKAIKIHENVLLN